MKLSDFVVDFIAAQGVKHIFLVTGGGAMHLNDAAGGLAPIQAAASGILGESPISDNVVNVENGLEHPWRRRIHKIKQMLNSRLD